VKLTITAAVTAIAFTHTAAGAATVVVTTPAGVFTNNGPTNMAGPGVGFDQWFANNVRNGGSAGITTTNPNNGNGSLAFSGPANAKADFEYYFSAPNQFLLSDLNALSYDYYRSSSSTAGSQYAPALRLSVTNGTQTGYLVYEGIYNGTPVSPVNSFIAANTISAKFWATGSLPDAFNNYDRTLSDWTTLVPNLRVTALSTGIGSGWNGSFEGAVDQITFGVAGRGTTTFNFEAGAVAAVPETSTWLMMLVGFGMIGTTARYRRRTTKIAYA